MDELEQIADKGLSLQDATFLIHAATENYPDDKGSPWHNSAASLIELATKSKDAKLLAPLREVFDQLKPPEKAAVMDYLIQLNTNESLKWFAELFPRQADQLHWYPSTSKALAAALPNEILLPAVWESLKHENTVGIGVSALLDAVNDRHLRDSVITENQARIVEAYHPLLAKLSQIAARANSTGTGDYRWEDDYQRVLDVAEYFPDLLGYAGPAAQQILRDTLALDDPRMSFFAIRSLLQMHQDPPQAAIERVAADDEMRNMLYESLVKNHAEKRFPEKYHTQEAFARSEMVHWLVYPTELGRPPNDIELMKVTDISTQDGIYSYYLFRFRTTGKHEAAKDGWMAGLAGGYKKVNAPTTSSSGDTFSKFERFDAKTPDEHIRDITDLIKDHWKKRAEELQKK